MNNTCKVTKEEDHAFKMMNSGRGSGHGRGRAFYGYGRDTQNKKYIQ